MEELIELLKQNKDKEAEKKINEMLQDKNNIDYASPIFDQDNKEIGYAFIYHHDLKDYSPYIINSEYKTAIKLYFHNLKFHSKSITYKSRKYFCLINKK